MDLFGVGDVYQEAPHFGLFFTPVSGFWGDFGGASWLYLQLPSHNMASPAFPCLFPLFL